MTDHLIFLLLGLSNGAVFGALALALVVTYRSSGVLNFGTGAIALFTAYTYAYLRTGELLVLIPGLPKTVDIGGPMGFWPAAVLALALAAILGLLLYLLIFRPLRAAPAVAKAVASIGLTVIFTGLIAQRVGNAPIGVKAIFPGDVWTIGDVRVSADRVYFAITILGVAAVLAAIYQFTRFGLATRAAAESEKGAYVSGISPDRVAAFNWMISTAVAGLSGILIAPIVPLIPISYSLFIVPALAAAILGGFRLAPAVIAGLVIGMLQSESQYLSSSYDWLPQSGLSELVPLVLILVVLVVRARPLPSRGAVVVQALGRAPRPRTLLLPTVVPTALAVVLLFALDGQWRNGLISSLIFAVLALSLVVVTGYAGQISLAQITLAGAAGFLLGPMADDWGIPFPLSPLLAALAATVLGVVIGLPALRIRGLTVAVVTLALAFALEAFWFRNLDFVSSSGIAIKDAELFGLDLGVGSGLTFPRVEFGLFCLLVLVLVALGVAGLRRSQLGSQMLAVRANEKSAAAAGVNVTAVKLFAFAIAAFIAGIGGCLMAYQQSTVSFEPFTALAGLGLFTTAYLAGITSVSGGILAGIIASGGLVYIATDEWLSTGGWYEVISGVGLVLTVILNPEGIVGPAHELVGRMRGGAGGRVTGSLAATVVDRQVEPVAVRDGDPALLSIRDVGVRYGGVVAVAGVSFDVPQGRIVGLIGPNGAGKTTLMDAISGFAPSTGSVVMAGRQLETLAPHQRVRAGLGRTFQAIELYDDLSVSENVVVGLSAHGRDAVRGARERLGETLDLLGLGEVRHRPARELSQGQRQLVSIARALSGHPKVLLLDEPAGGLDTTESHWLGDRLRDIRDTGVTILLVDHDMSLVLGLCDEIQVLNFGEIIAAGTPAQIRADRGVAAAYLGSTHAEGADV